MVHGVNCEYCGRYRSYEAMTCDYTPDTHFTAEEIVWKCKDSTTCLLYAEARDRALAAAEQDLEATDAKP